MYKIGYKTIVGSRVSFDYFCDYDDPVEAYRDAVDLAFDEESLSIKKYGYYVIKDVEANASYDLDAFFNIVLGGVIN